MQSLSCSKGFLATGLTAFFIIILLLYYHRALISKKFDFETNNSYSTIKSAIFHTNSFQVKNSSNKDIQNAKKNLLEKIIQKEEENLAKFIQTKTAKENLTSTKQSKPKPTISTRVMVAEKQRKTHWSTISILKKIIRKTKNPKIQLSRMSMQTMLNLNKNIKNPGNFSDPKYLSNCTIVLNRVKVFNLFKDWINFAAEHNIFWFLVDGTLIGAKRHKDIIPYDHDVDIAIFSADEAILRIFQTNRSEMSDDKMNIIVRPGYHDSKARMDCEGQLVPKMTDSCSFTGPIARLMFKSHDNRIDIFSYHIGHFKSNNNTKMAIYSEEEYKSFPFSDIIPLRKCRFLGLQLLCPNKPIEFLKKIYENNEILIPNRICVKGKWKRI